MLGPTGIGGLYVKLDVLERMTPFLTGGEMVLAVTYEDATWDDLPKRFEAGTPNIADAIGLGAAVDYLQALGMDNVREHEKSLTRYALDAFKGAGRGTGCLRAERCGEARRNSVVPSPGCASARPGDCSG